MFTLLYILAGIVYLMPGLVLARGVYSEQVRAIRTDPKPKYPARPAKPEIKVGELLHYRRSDGTDCSCLILDRKNICTCKSRNEWIKLKNRWEVYDEWQTKYGHLCERYGEFSGQTLDMKPVYGAILAWPLVGAMMFVKGGAKNIPDYREIERLEKDTDMKEID